MREFEINDIEKGLVAEKDSIRRKLVSKWKNRFQTISADEAVLCENTSRAINESTTSVDIEGYNGFAFKLIRRVYANLIAKELVSVQPMLGPQGKVFYLNPMITTGTSGDFQNMHEAHYNDANFDVSRGAYTIVTGSGVEISETNYVSGTPFNIPYSGGVEGISSLIIGAPYDVIGFSGSNVRFASASGSVIYTDEDVRGVFDKNYAVPAILVAIGTSGSVTVELFNPPAAPVTRYSIMFLTGATVYYSATSWSFCGSTDGINWNLLDYRIGESPVRNTVNHYTPTDVSTPYKFYTLSGIGRTTANQIRISEIEMVTDGIGEKYDYVISPTTWSENIFSGNQLNVMVQTFGPYRDGMGTVTAATAWRSYATKEAETNMQLVKLNVVDEDIAAVSRWMKAHFTDELAQDMYALFGLHAEDELANMVGDELSAEIDREIIRDLIKIAPYRSEWWYDYNSASAITGSSFFTSGDSRYDSIPSSGASIERLAWETLFLKINQMDGQLKKTNLYHGANWLICSTKVGSVIESMPEFKDQIGDVVDQNRIHRTGKLKSTINVYIDPYLPDNVCLLGYNGANWDAGYVYAPYVMANTTEVIDPDGLNERTFAFLTRYGKKVVNNKKYGLIFCTFPDWYDVTND